ncbi:PepSY domain-containing protein [Streptomyces sp. SJL17-1]|uniref:PepSY domain-containing protein n=1 Tax=Streptomyces sp. SJL17-1 TaxID=2967223 RepID=UPI0029673941|nr:PepSY domain-containing protein [Streptomyces sp. SJL17-1]
MKRTPLIAALTATALVCGGASVALADDRADRADRDEARDAKVTAVQAIDAALKAQPGTVVAADLDDDGWEVELLGKGTTSYTVHVDATTGKVVAEETDADDDESDDRGTLKGAGVDAREAAEAASAKGFVTSLSLDDDDRSWDVETGDDADWNVDLKTAKVTPDTEATSAASEADDADDAADHDD